MATLKSKGQQTSTIQVASEGADVFLRSLRDGTAVTADWKQAAVMGGFGFTAFGGTFSTGGAGGGVGSTIDLDRPQFLISIPNGTTVVPLRISIQTQTGDPANEEEMELLIGVDQDKAIPTDGTAGSNPTVYNMNTGTGNATTCIVRQTFAATMTTDPTLDLELARKVLEFDKVGTPSVIGVIMDLDYEPETPIIINGPAAIICYAGGNAAQVGAFVQAFWLEFTETKFRV